MQQDDLTYCDGKMKEMRTTLTNLADEKSFQDFATIIRKPGFTTIAEVMFIRGMMDAMHEQAKLTLSLKQALLGAANKVALNPQPLPPKA